MSAAARVFLRDGHGLSSIDRVAAEAGMSTRTIYQRFRNKADLLGSVIGRLIDRTATMVATSELKNVEPRVALFGIIVTEAHRFPVAARMLVREKRCVQNGVADYFRGQILRGTLIISDPDKAAKIFLQMIIADLHEQFLFGPDRTVSNSDVESHLRGVIEIFILGAAPRSGAAGGPV
jgi:AcrR family transcriptional regulator